MLRELFHISLEINFLHRKRFWLKVVAISSLIFMISLTNYLVRPFQWNTLVEPYNKASFTIVIYYDFIGDISNRTYPIKVETDKLTNDILAGLERQGLKVQDYVLIFKTTINDYDAVFISDIEKIYLTPYSNIIDGDIPTEPYEALIPVNFGYSKPTIIDGQLVIGSYEMGISGVYIGDEDDIVLDIDILEDENFIYKVDCPCEFQEYIGSVRIYLLLPNYDRNRLLNGTLDALLDIVYRYNQSGYIRIIEEFSEEDLVQSILSSISLREDIISSTTLLYNQQYNNPTSMFTFFTYGGLIIFLLYLLKVSIDIIRDQIESVAVLYALGSPDKHIIFITLLGLTYYIVPSIILGGVGVNYIARELWGYTGLSPLIILQWLSPLIISSIVFSYLSISVSLLFYIRRVGLGRVLAEEF